jgi:integrase
MEHLPRHAALALALALGYFAGMRKGEILGLAWDRVDMKERVIRLRAEDTKTSEAREIPVCGEIFTILEKTPRALHDSRVVLYKGKPVSDLRAALRRASGLAGIPYGRERENGWCLHDTRHSFVTNLRRAGVQESDIMAVTGHSTRQMFDRYNRVDLSDTRVAVELLGKHLRENAYQNACQGVSAKNKGAAE